MKSRTLSLVALCLLTGIGCSGSSDGLDLGGQSGGGGGSAGATMTGGSASGGVTMTGGSASGGATGGSGGAPGSASDVCGKVNDGSYDTKIGAGEFSFFVISMNFILSKAPCTTSANDGATCLGGLGGDLGGLSGADGLCEEAAKKAHPGDKHLWRAFLSVTDCKGSPLNAIDRIGSGPWYSAPPKLSNKTNYDTDGLLMASNTAGLTNTRPAGSTDIVLSYYISANQSGRPGSMGGGACGHNTDQSATQTSTYSTQCQWPFNQCLTDETGVCVLSYGDNHDTLTGSDANGKLASTKKTSTCDDWTNSTTRYGSPGYGHSWPRQMNNVSGTEPGWIHTDVVSSGCGKIINVTDNNYGMGGVGTWSGGVGSDGGYGGFYCFAYSE